MAKIIDTLHPENAPIDDLYPNIVGENIPSKSVTLPKLGSDVLNFIASGKDGSPDYVGTSTQILSLTENKGLAVATDTGHWYYWNGTQYIDGGVYQSSGIGNHTIYEDNLIPRMEYLANQKNVASIDASYVNASISSITGELVGVGENPIRVASSDFIEIDPLSRYVVKFFDTYACEIYCYNNSGAFLYEENGDWLYDGYIFIPKGNVTKIRILVKHINNVNISASNWKNFGIAVFRDENYKMIANARSINNPVFKFMTFNVGFFHNGATQLPDNEVDNQRARYKNMIKKYNPDIIVTQETTQYVNVSNSVPGESFFNYKYFNYLGTDGVQGKRFISNYFMTSPIFYTFGSDNRDYQLSYMYINGIKVAVITTHLSLDDTVRASQLSTLLTFVQNFEYFILAGDFNIDDFSELSGFTALGYKIANGGALGTFVTATGASEHPDNIIVSANIDLCYAEVDTEFDIFSDHRPFIATLQIGSPTITQPDDNGEYILKLDKTSDAYKYQWISGNEYVESFFATDQEVANMLEEVFE